MRRTAAVIGAVAGIALGVWKHDAKAEPTVLARPANVEHRYEKLYWRVVRSHGRRAPGRNLVTRGISTHGRVRAASTRELARSIRTFKRWLAPPRGPVAATDRTPHGQSPAYAGGKWAIPAYIVMCESGGDYGAVNSSSGARGAYQLMPSTYYANGGDGSWSPADQDRVAAKVYAEQGAAPWECG